jgi:hypothetical protein
MQTNASVKQHLRELEEELLQPHVRKIPERVAELLAEEFVEFGSLGRRYNKTQIIETLQAESSSRWSLSEFEVSLLSSDVALATYRAVQHTEPPVHSLRSSIWILRDGHWKMVFHQGTLTDGT